MLRWLIKRLNARPVRAWHRPGFPRPYEVGPGASVGPMNPAPSAPTVGGVADGPLRPLGAARFLDPPYVNGSYAERRARSPEDGPNVTPWDKALQCGHCTFRTPFGPAMSVHLRTEHPPTP